MKVNYRYVYTKQQEPTLQGELIKDTSRMLKDVTKYSKGKYTYVHIYKATEAGWEYMKTEYGLSGFKNWLSYVDACNESDSKGFANMIR